MLLGRHWEDPPWTPNSFQALHTPLQSITVENREFIRTHRPQIDRQTKGRLLSTSSSLESIQAKLAVVEEENRELRELTRPQKRKQAGVTVGDMGQHHFTDENVCAQVQAADVAGEARKRAKGKERAREDTPEPPQQRPEAEDLVNWYARQLGACSQSTA